MIKNVIFQGSRFGSEAAHYKFQFFFSWEASKEATVDGET